MLLLADAPGFSEVSSFRVQLGRLHEVPGTLGAEAGPPAHYLSAQPPGYAPQMGACTLRCRESPASYVSKVSQCVMLNGDCQSHSWGTLGNGGAWGDMKTACPTFKRWSYSSLMDCYPFVKKSQMSRFYVKSPDIN